MLALGGCGGVDVNAIGAGPWPVYSEPAALVFTGAEAAELRAWKARDPALFTKIQSQSHQYRAVLREHNKRARELNKKRLEMLGFKEADVKAVFEKGPE